MTSRNDTAGTSPRADDAIRLRAACQRDLGAINALIEAALDTWNVSARVKRLSLPLYQYDAHDLDHLDIVVAETCTREIVGLASLQAAEPCESPAGQTTALLHGLFVKPAWHGMGIGSQLLRQLRTLAASKQYRTLLVKAHAEAQPFFKSRGYSHVPVQNPDEDYPYRYCVALQPAAEQSPRRD